MKRVVTVKNYRGWYLEREEKKTSSVRWHLDSDLKNEWETEVLEGSGRKTFQTEGNRRPKVGNSLQLTESLIVEESTTSR